MQRLTITEAAQALGISTQAVHGRIKRGTLDSDKGEDGKLYVYVERNGAGNGVGNDMTNHYIDALRSQIANLEQEKEDWKEEARRKDHLLAAALERIPPALEAAEETRESPVPDSEGEFKSRTPPEAEKPSWWKRLFSVDQ
jgi:hypothetical protein